MADGESVYFSLRQSGKRFALRFINSCFWPFVVLESDTCGAFFENFSRGLADNLGVGADRSEDPLPDFSADQENTE